MALQERSTQFKSRTDMRRYSLRTLLILLAAAPLWIFLIVVLPQSPGLGPVGFVIVPLVLVGVAAAIHRLTRTAVDGWAIAALLSPIIAFSFLAFVAAMAQ